MNPKELRIVFFGTPLFAAHILENLIEAGYNVVAVVTAPDKPAGRGLKINQSEVKRVALQYQIPILQPESLKSTDFLNQLIEFSPQIQIVVAFRMMPESVWSLPPYGTFNLHASLLPQYRGAAPIQWAIINGETTTGLTTFLLDKQIDTGMILLREPMEIQKGETAGQLHDRMMVRGAILVCKTIDALALGNVKPMAQDILVDDNAELKNAPKILREHCEIDWNKPAHTILALIRGLCPMPGAFTTFSHGNKTHLLKIYEANAEIKPHNYKPGELVTDGKTALSFATPDGFIHLRTLKLEGKKQVTATEFLRGYRF
ncbi:MAG TPA: methionyl-tRNA formyltransferase [Bacteroidales bacterium]|nr:methionyl-tRNA formyltransferase [Bacteroidales bacterium]